MFSQDTGIITFVRTDKGVVQVECPYFEPRCVKYYTDGYRAGLLGHEKMLFGPLMEKPILEAYEHGYRAGVIARLGPMPQQAA